MKMSTISLFLLVGAGMGFFGQPAITIQPKNQTASLFADATFQVIAAGDAPLSYQWRFNDADLSGMTNSTLTVTNVQRTAEGVYRVIVTNFSGSVASQAASLTIVPFNALYSFGFSWTDTDNCSSVFTQPKYYEGRASNGPLWPEFLSTNLGLAYVQANNYAQCGASPADILNQTINFPAPRKPQLSLYCLWAESPTPDYPVMVNALTDEAAGNLL